MKKSLKIPKGNQNPYIYEEQTTQWPKEKGQKDKHRSIKHYTENYTNITLLLRIGKYQVVDTNGY
jgi:hypothetical protein